MMCAFFAAPHSTLYATSALANTLDTDNATVMAEQSAPLKITFEFVPLQGALDDAFLGQVMEAGPNLQSSEQDLEELAATAQETALIIWIEPQQGYYAYAHEPLIATLPTTVTLLHNGNVVEVQTLYPTGVPKKDSFETSKTIMAYIERTPIIMAIPSELLSRSDISFMVSGLLCTDSNCWPFDELVEVTAPSAPAGLSHEHKSLSPMIARHIGHVGHVASSLFGPRSTQENANNNENAKKNENQEQSIAEWHLTPNYAAPSLEVSGLGKALLFGLLAGLILNVMPCVLPVIGFKLSAFVAAANKQDDGADHIKQRQERVRAFREHNIFFALGILTWFMVLAAVLSWAGLAWGQLFQQTPVLFGLILLVFLMSLSMFGVFSLPVLDIKTGASNSPRMQAFMTGAVATLLATPCSGPLLGGVLGWAFGQGPLIMGMVFVAVGFGMAMPYVALSIWPNLVHKVPRAGAWTGTVEQIVGFFLMATSLYLLMILPKEIMNASLYTLFVAALCAWIWGRWSGPAASRVQRVLVRFCTVGIIVFMSIWTLSPREAEQELWQNFNAITVQNMLGNERLVLEFTADWCPNCKVLERTTLTHENVQAWAKDYNVRFVRVDLTRNETVNDAAAQALLRALGSQSIPLVALFPTGEEHASPLVLRDIFTPAQMDEALKQAFEK